jgi:hypothetical protein
MISAFVLIEAITYSGLGQALYRTVTWDSPGAHVPALDFGTPPGSALGATHS